MALIAYVIWRNPYWPRFRGLFRTLPTIRIYEKKQVTDTYLISS